MSSEPQTPGMPELIARLRSTAADMVDFHGKTMKEWDHIRSKCLSHRGSDLPRLMFEGLIEGFSELMIEAADALAAPPARSSDESAEVTRPLSEFQRKLDASVTPQQAADSVRREREALASRHKPHPQPDGFINDYD